MSWDWLVRRFFPCLFLILQIYSAIGFDYNFNSVQDETNELLIAYKDMFEVAISQSTMFRKLLSIYLPTINQLFVGANPCLCLYSPDNLHIA
jgi:hypothetical protein